MPDIHRSRLNIGLVKRALWIWDKLDLEIGDLAVVTSSDVKGRVLATVAAATGASPVLLVGDSWTNASVPNVNCVSVEQFGRLSSSIRKQFRGKPSVAAAECTGRAEVIELLLATLPIFSRVIVAGTSFGPLNIDFYLNLHKKGLILHAIEFDSIFSDSLSSQDEIAYELRASRLLSSRSFLGAYEDAYSVT